MEKAERKQTQTQNPNQGQQQQKNPQHTDKTAVKK